MVAFVSSVAGGVAATGWFLFRASTPAVPSSAQSSQTNNDRWTNPFGDLKVNSATSDRHPSWSASRGNTNSNDRDGDESDGGQVASVHVSRASPKGERENAQQYGTGHIDGGKCGKGNGEREAGVWVGWGGGCAF